MDIWNLKLWNFGILKLWSFETSRLGNFGTLELWNFETLKHWNFRPLKFELNESLINRFLMLNDSWFMAQGCSAGALGPPPPCGGPGAPAKLS